MTLSAPLLTVTAVLGLAVGSFLNVCIYRIPRNESLVYPASRCPDCAAPLRWFDNIPVVSWLALNGRCRECGRSISKQYPIVELITAMAAVTIVLATPPGWLLVSRLVLAALLIVLFAIDLELQILPNAITLPGIAAGLLLSLVAPPGFAASIVGALLGGGLLYAVAAGYYAVRREEGLGMGDVKMLAMIGAFLGWRAVFLTLVLSSFAGALVGIAFIVARRASMRYALPFGTFLAIAGFVTMLAGDAILEWYSQFYELD